MKEVVESEKKQVLENIKAILQAAGASLDAAKKC